MAKKTNYFIAVGISALFLTSICATSANASSTARTITVSGQGVVNFTDDIGDINITMSESAATPVAAENSLNNLVLTVRKALTANNKPSISNNGFNLSPQYNYSDTGTTLTGYQAQYSIVVKDVFANIGSLVSDAVSAGGPALSVTSISFENSKRDTFVTQAEKLAVQNAKQKASNYLSATGDKLGSVISITEENNNSTVTPRVFAAANATVASPLPVAQSLDNVTVDIQVTYQIL